MCRIIHRMLQCLMKVLKAEEVKEQIIIQKHMRKVLTHLVIKKNRHWLR